MKVISGLLKGRVIEGFDIDGTRPTMDRVKESLFGSIQNYVPESVVLDLFSGSGNLGIEAISNGSDLVYFNDKNVNAYKTIKSNVEKFNISEKSIIMNYDYMKCLSILNEKQIKFDIIFLDPPYKMTVLNDVIKYLFDNSMLKKDGIIICEVSSDYIDNYKNLEIIKDKKYGDKKIIILKNICK